MPVFKKSKHVQAIAVLCVLLFSQTKANTPTSLSWYVPNIIAPVHLTRDTTTLILTDYFIEPSKVDSLVFSEAYKGHWNKKDNTIQIITNGKTPPLTELKIWSEGKNTSVLLHKFNGTNPATDITKAPRLATLQANKNAFTFSADNGVTDIFVYWQNARLKVKFTHAANQTIQVEIPEEARHKTRSFIRVFACNQTGAGNDLLIPLQSGEVVTDYKSLDRYDLHTLSIGCIPGNWLFSDTLQGTESIITEYFDQMHFNTLCLSPIIHNHSNGDSVLKNIVSMIHKRHGNILISEQNGGLAKDVDSALIWINRFDLDGFVYDQGLRIYTKSFYRSLTMRLKEIEIHQHRPFYQFSLSEKTSEFADGCIGSGLLDGHNDLNLSDAAKIAFTNDSAGFKHLATALQQSMTSFGSHHLMTNEFASYSNDINKMTKLIAFDATVPGLPLFAYTALKGNELKNKTAQLFLLRAQHMSLMYGDFNILQADQNTLAYERNYFNETTIVIFNNSAQSKSVSVKVTPALNGQWVAQFGNKYSLKEDMLIVQLPAKSFEILIGTGN